MNKLPTLLLALALVGCIGGGDEAEAPPTTPTTPSDNAALPAPIQDSREVAGGLDPLNNANQPPCSTPGAQCQRYPLEVNVTTNATIELTWTIPANDFDLYIFEDGEPTEMLSGASPPGTSESITGQLTPGSYEIVVVPWAVTRDTYTLNATFA